MKSLNAKRIAAIAASLAMGLVFGSGVSIGNVPIINSAGQPVVQIVVGSTAQPSDGVVAANIAAVIGNLAFTSTPITATVQGTSGLTCSVTTPSCTLSNQQVWLGERGAVVSGGSYGFKALIGSVLNGGAQNYNTLQYSKTLQGGASNQYSYPQSAASNGGYPITSTPTATSPFTGLGSLNLNSSVVSGTNGGGLSFSQLSNFANSQNYDNILELGQSQVPGLLSNSGTYQESEYLWVEGFPVYDQASGVANFAVLDAAGAYQVTFGKPVPLYTNVSNFNSNTVNHASITILGQTWSVFGGAPPTDPLNAAGPASQNFLVGGSIQLAQSQTPLTTVYVGHNLSSGSVTVALQDLSYPNSNGIASASIGVYNNGVLTNTTSVAPGTTKLINSSGTKVYVYVDSTFPGLYAYQKWAKMQLFNNVINVTSGGKPFSTTNKQWNALIRWTTNETTPAGAFVPNAQLQGITIYSNTTRYVQTLTAGQSITFIQDPAMWKVTFDGDSLGTPGSGNTNYDTLGFSTSQATLTYANPKTNGATTTTGPTASWMGNIPTQVQLTSTVPNTVNASSITEPVDKFSVTSTLPAAFTVTSQTSEPSPSSSLSSLNYSLDTLQLAAQNTVNAVSFGSGQTNVVSPGLVVNVLNTGYIATGTGNYLSNAHPLTVSVTGYRAGTKQSPVTLSFTSFGQQVQAGTLLDNVSNIQLGYAVPNGITVQVFDTVDTANPNLGALETYGTNSVLLATATEAGPYLEYKVPQYDYNMAVPANYVGSSTTANVVYNGEGAQLPFLLSASYPANSASRGQYFTYNVPLITNPQAPTSANAFLYLGITNSSTVGSSPAYWLNRTNTYQNAWQYTSTQGNNVNATVGFRTERGDQIASVSTSSTTLDLAKTIDTLIFVGGPANATGGLSTTSVGPFSVGESTNIPNVTIAAVNATCTFSTTSCNVTGIGNLTAVPSVSQATTPAHLNTATDTGTPLAVLDTNANSTSSLIVIGSRYVNSVAKTIFSNNPSINNTFGPGSTPIVQAFGNKILVAGYSASDTVTAGNQFIQELLSAASSS